MAKIRFPRVLVQTTGAIGAVLVALLSAQVPAFAQSSAINHLFPEMHTRTVASVTGQNGDANPYGVTIVPFSAGKLVAGDILVADFNNQAGTTGSGTTIMQVNPSTGQSSVFYQSSQMEGPVGIAVNAANDIVWVAYYGSQANGSAGGYAVIKPNGQLAVNFTNANTGSKPSQFFEGVWGADFAKGAFFWTNVGMTKTGAGEVWRLNPNPNGPVNGQPLNSTYQQIGEGLPIGQYSGNNPLSAATAAGPEDMVYDPANGNLYVTDDANNTIYAIPNALTATSPQQALVVSTSPLLQSPQGIAINPINGMLLVVNGAVNNQLLEINPANGQVVATRTLDSGTPGALFGLATAQNSLGQLQVYFDNSHATNLDVLNGPAAGYSGYEFAQSSGLLATFGAVAPADPTMLSNKVVGVAQMMTSSGHTGYWEANANGMVSAFGAAQNYGNAAGLRLNAPIVGIVATPDGQGYWLVAADGGVFAFGDAGFYGNTYTDGLTGLGGSHPLAAPIVGMAPTPNGDGYWLVAADGGVFAFGNAGFYGNTYTDGLTGLGGSHPLAAPIVGIAASPDGQGYWLAGADGGVFAFGDAHFYGNTYTDGLTGLAGMHPLNKPVIGIVATPDGGGYWLLAADGGAFAFGNAMFSGSASGSGLTFSAVSPAVSY